MPLRGPITRSERLSLTLSARWWAFRDWCLRWWFAQHNARVLIDFENRMTSLVYEASGGMMSKPYYTIDAMLEQVRAARIREWEEGYAEGRSDLAEEAEIVDPSPFVPEHLAH